MLERNFKMTNYKYTAEQLLSFPETKERLDNYGEEEHIALKIKLDLARTENYKENIFYHANSYEPDCLGEGLHLGKDKKAVDNFYNNDGTEGEVEEYIGEPLFIDLAYYDDFDNFEKEAIEKFGKQPNKKHLRALTLAKGFDGIRYYEPTAIGEEFVLYNTEKVFLSYYKTILHDLIVKPSDYKETTY